MAALKFKSHPPLRWPESRSLAVLVIIGFLSLGLVKPLFAEDPYLASGKPDGIALLPPPPISGSEEEAADLASARAVFAGRSATEEARAFKDASLSFSLFEPVIGPVFHLESLPKTDALLQEIKKEIGQPIDIPKDYWKRRRPYQLDERLCLREPEPSPSYPSGHSTRGTVYALVLAELFPEKKDVILKMGRDIGWDRVLIGKHFPTDVYAGRVLGKAIVRKLMANAAFQHDLAKAKAEILQADHKVSPQG